MSEKTDKPGDWREDESSVLRAYGKLKKVAPPAHLDERILAEARRAAAGEDSTVVRVHRWRRWAMPAALAATVVFAVPLVVRVFETTAPVPQQATAPATLETDTASGALADRLPAEAARRELAAPPGQKVAEPAGPAPASRLDQPAPTALAATDDSAGRLRDSARVATEESRDPGRKPEPADKPIPMPQAGEAEAFAITAPAAAPQREQMDDAQIASMAADMELAEQSRHGKSQNGARSLMPDAWLDEIVLLHESGRELTARRELGMFLAEHPGYELPQRYPLQAEDAISPGVIPDARDWLRDIARLVEKGETDRARMQLAEFLDYYPDYPLPADFPLRREDAVIER